MSDPVDLSKIPLCDLEAQASGLEAEIARRKKGAGGNAAKQRTLTEIELEAEALGRRTAHGHLEEELHEIEESDSVHAPCPKCKKPVRKRGRRKRNIQTLHGTVQVERNYHYCDNCRLGFYPADEALGVSRNGQVSRELERRILDFGVTTTYAQAAERFELHYGFSISTNLLRCVVSRVGDMEEASDPRYVQAALKRPPEETQQSSFVVVEGDGGMVRTREKPDAWKECKLGMLYPLENHVRGGAGIRGQVSSARYVGVLGGAEEFKESLDAALLIERGTLKNKVIWLGDGAKMNWRVASELCPTAIQILDFYHVMEHACSAARVFFGEGSWEEPLFRSRMAQLLLHAEPSRCIEELKACISLTDSDEELKALNDLVRYLRNNESRIHYAQYRASGFPIATGGIESAHKHVIQDRMKKSGQHWEAEHAKKLVKLRVAYRTAGPKNFQKALYLAKSATDYKALPKAA